jgi:hypothetical protein
LRDTRYCSTGFPTTCMVDLVATETFDCQGGTGDQGRFEPVDSRRSEVEIVRVAIGIWGVQREPVAGVGRRGLHPQSARASSQNCFRQEYILLLKRHGVEYDERYIWT